MKTPLMFYVSVLGKDEKLPQPFWVEAERWGGQ